jgi:pyridoxamine 5'-phosphate oxidase
LKLHAIHREYGAQALHKDMLSSDPFLQFEQWLQFAISHHVLDPTAMTLATIDEHGMPDARMVLLKEINAAGFIFFTHYTSPKACQAEQSGAALVFYWPELNRQVRVKGTVQRIARAESEAYFASRSRQSQLSTAASKQSNVIANRDILEQQVQVLAQQYADKPVPCPEHWGGYRVVPILFEFFQGRDNRLNDRIRYQLINNIWQIDRLSP